MEYITDIRTIEKLMDEKKTGEISMAKILRDEIFAKEPVVLKVIQGIAYQAIYDLMATGVQREVAKYIDDKANPRAYRFFTKERVEARGQANLINKPWDQLLDICAKTTTAWRPKPPHGYFDPEDCSDAMRLYAEFIEECHYPRGEYPESGKKFNKTKSDILKTRIWSYKEWIQARRKIRGEQKILKKKKWGFIPYTKKDRMIESRKQVVPKWRGAPKKDPFEAAKYKMKGGEKESDFVRRAMAEGAKLGDKTVRVRRAAMKQETDVMIQNLIRKYGVVQAPAGGPKAGVAFWKLMPQSSILQLDRMFGLTEIGADISGTTADTVGVMEVLYHAMLELGDRQEEDEIYDHDLGRWQPRSDYNRQDTRDGKTIYTRKRGVEPTMPEKPDEGEHTHEDIEIYLHMRPIIALLPLATMVSLGHHTSLECAYVLSRNDYIDYSVGFYTSLFPPEWYELKEEGGAPKYDLNVQKDTWMFKYKVPMKVKEIAENVFRILRFYETHESNHKLMMYYDKNGRFKGAFKIDYATEGKRFRDLATISQNLDTYMYRFYHNKETRYPHFHYLVDAAVKHNLIAELKEAYEGQRRDPLAERKPAAPGRQALSAKQKKGLAADLLKRFPKK